MYNQQQQYGHGGEYYAQNPQRGRPQMVQQPSAYPPTSYGQPNHFHQNPPNAYPMYTGYPTQQYRVMQPARPVNPDTRQNQPTPTSDGSPTFQVPTYAGVRKLSNAGSDATTTHSRAESQKELMNTNRVSTDSTLSYNGKKRYCVGCFSSRRTCVGVCTIITILLMAGIGVAVFFLFPRAPTITISDPFANGVSNLNAVDFKTAQNGAISLSVPLMIKIDVFSPNFVSLGFDGLEVKAFLLDPDGSSKTVSGGPVGVGAIGKTKFAPKTTTQFTLPFNVTFASESGVADIQGEPIILAIARQCGRSLFPSLPPAQQPNMIPLRIDGIFSSRVIDWTGFVPKFTRKMVFPCPSSVLDFLAPILQKQNIAT